MEQEYIITLKNPSDWEQFHEQMILEDNQRFIPERPVDCSNERPFNETQSHYLLTELEAETLRQDPRVAAVELHPNLDPKIHIRTCASINQTFDNTNSITNNMKNWGLLRGINTSNPFSASSSLQTNLNYNLTGRGVDIVLIDSGIAENHPEFAVNANGTGGSRVQNYDWTSLGVAGVTALAGGSGINGFLGDCDGHGSNCASIAAGNTCGWARDARIYSIRAIPSSFGSDIDIVTGNTLGLVDITLVFDLVKAFHLSKPIEANGYRRPTICSNSWAFTKTYTSMQQTRYRGTYYSTISPNTNYGQVGGAGGSHGVRYTSIDASVASAMEAGVIILGAAGNFRHKVDVSGGLDYNNFWTDGTYTYYYHRGSSPGSTTYTLNGTTYQTICVGALDRVNPERKASFSETGPRVDVYSPGYYIMGCASNNYTSVSDSRNTSYKLSKLSGSSQATPQVSGMLACVAELRPWITQNWARNWVIANSTPNLLDQATASGTGYTNYYYLQGGNNRIMYMPFNANESLKIQGSVTANTAMRVL